jgi:uncharacterized protein YsxB (DUF464 family)
MTKIVFYRSGGVFYGFEESGHSGYGEAGDDILCAALSAMTMLLLNTIEIAYASDVEYTIDEKTADITVAVKAALPDYEHDPTKRYAVSGVIEGYYLQLMDMLEDYYDYLDVNLEDKEF